MFLALIIHPTHIHSPVSLGCVSKHRYLQLDSVLWYALSHGRRAVNQGQDGLSRPLLLHEETEVLYLLENTLL